MRIGIIGTGQMGGMLAEALAEAGHSELSIVNRTQQKADRLQAAHPHSIVVCATPLAVAERSELLFVCTKFSDLPTVFEQMSSAIAERHTIVSINSNSSLDDLETRARCNIAKVIPSVTQYARAGVLLTMFGPRMNDADRQSLRQVLQTIGTPLEIAEADTRIYSDLSSCGPAFLSDWLNAMASAASERGIAVDTAVQVLGQMVLGVGKLLTERGVSFTDIIDTVAVPNGVTIAGLRVLRECDRELFSRVFSATAARQQEISQHGHS